MFAGLSMTPRLYSELPLQGSCKTFGMRICDWSPPVTRNTVDDGLYILYGLWSNVKVLNLQQAFPFYVSSSRISILDRWPLSVVILFVKEYSDRSCLFRLVWLQTYWVCDLYNTQHFYYFLFIYLFCNKLYWHVQRKSTAH